MDKKKKFTVEVLSKRLQTIFKENNCNLDQLCEVTIQGHSFNESSDGYHEINEETKTLIQKKLKKAKEASKNPDYVFAGVLSEANIVTRNRTLYSYEVLNNAITDKEFKRGLKNKEIKFLADHPEFSWLGGDSGNSVLKEAAVLLEVFWEKKPEDPNSNDGSIEAILKSKKAPKEMPTTNGSPPYRMFGIFQLVGAHKEHFKDIIDNSRLGISSRGYGLSESVVWESEPDRSGETKRVFLYRELLGLELETWDFVTKQSVPSASVTSDDDFNEAEESKNLPDNVTDNIKEDYDVTVINQTEPESSEEVLLNKEESMNYEEVMKLLRETPEGAQALESIRQEFEKTNKLGELENKVEKLNTTIVEKETAVAEAVKEVEALKTANDMMKAELENLQAKVSEYQNAEFENYRTSFYAQWNDETVAKLKEDLDKCENFASFKKEADLLAKYIPETFKKNYVAPSVAEKLTTNSERTPTVDETASVVDHIKNMAMEKEEANLTQNESVLRNALKLARGY